MQMVKKVFHKITANFMLYYFILLLLIFAPKALTMPSLSFRTSIITAVGIDRVDDKIEVSILTLSQINQGDNKENNILVSARSDTVASAIGLLELRLGRKVQMGHVKFVLLSEDVARQDISNLVDSFVRTSKISNSVSLVICEGSAKNVLEAANKLSETSSYSLSEIISNDYNDTFTKETSIDYFFKGYFSPNQISSLGYIRMSDDESEGVSSGDQQAQPTGGSDDSQPRETSGESKTSKQKVISFNRENVVFKNGKMMRVLSKRDMDGLNWITTESTHQYIVLENFTEKEQNLENATITMEVVEKKVRDSVKFISNIPTITYTIILEVNILEIIQENDNISNTDIVMSKKMAQAISDHAKKQFVYSLNKLKEENADVINSYHVLNSTHYKQFQRMLKNLKNPEDYFKYIRFQMDIIPGFT